MIAASLLLLTGMASAAPIRFDLSLVQSWDEAPRPGNKPFILHFEKDGRHLYYVSAGHEGAGSDTHALIDRAFARFPIDRLIPEGRRRAKGEIANEPAPGGYESESNHALKLVLARKGTAVGGEAGYNDELTAILADGFKTEDFLGDWFVIYIPVFRREGTLDKKPLVVHFDETMTWLREESGIDASFKFGYDDFLKWYASRNGQPFDAAKVDNETAAPYKNGKLFTQRVSWSRDMLRNRFLLNAIGEELAKSKQVLVVYGSAHLACMRQAIEAAMGKPVYQGDLKD